MSQPHDYTLWIEVEAWVPGAWTPADANTDVIITFADGNRWVASFFSSATILTLTEKNRRTDECLAGAYLWSSDMMLIDKVSRPRIEEVVEHLIQEGAFAAVFTRLPPDDPADHDEAH